jgi:hypothetical protein
VVAPVAVEAPSTSWYGYQTLATDGGAVALATASPATSSNWFASLDGELTGAVVGGTLGLISASAIDAVFLAREVRPRGAGTDAAAGRAVRAGFEPSFAVSPERQGGGRALLGIVGRF